MLLRSSLILIFVIIFFSCNSEQEKSKADNKVQYSKKSLEKINQLLVEKDVEIIKNYIERREWDREMTETGLWYMIYEEGFGELIEVNDFITMNYKIWLMDGTLCYSSDSLGPKNFIAGKGGVESGLEEGILLLKNGSRARFIMPPHLAHGLIGDNKKIPARATIIYDVEIINVKKRNTFD